MNRADRIRNNEKLRRYYIAGKNANCYNCKKFEKYHKVACPEYVEDHIGNKAICTNWEGICPELDNMELDTTREGE